MQILQVSKYYQPHIGGVEKHLAKINQEFLKLGHGVTIITQSREKLRENEELDNIKIKRILTSNLETETPFRYKLKIWTKVIENLALFKKADLIHVHDVFWWLLPIYPFIYKKLFITFHGYEGNTLPSKKAIFWRKIANRLCQRSITVGKFQKKYYQIKADAIIYGATDLTTKKTKKANNKLIFLGRLAADNGILTYLEALKILKSQGKNYHLDVFGDGLLKKTAEDYAKKEKLDIRFYGKITNAQQKLANYPQAFVSSYLSIIEALASGCQVISYADNPLKKDYLRETPFSTWISINQSAKEISEQILKSTKPKTVAQNWAQAQTWEKIAQSYLDLWKKS